MNKKLKIALFWFLSICWGTIMTSIGALVAFILLLCGKKPKMFHQNIYFVFGKRNWGGINFGPFFFAGEDTLHIKQHESGHGLQNCVLGPFMPFVVGLPSLIRCGVRRCSTQDGMYAFAWALWMVVTTVSIMFSVIPLATGVYGLFVIPSLLLVYVTAILLWLLKFEIPKYENNKFVLYDSIWFEGQATTLGEKYYK